MEEILHFLRELKATNNREWMAENKPRYKQLQSKFELTTELLINEIRTFDTAIGFPSPKECIFRLNRDIRFSTDKTPYKTYFGTYIANGGRKSKTGGYYLHISPGDSFLAVGIYCPMSPELKKIRREIDLNGDELTDILEASELKETFEKLWGETLKTAPRDYSKEHPYIKFLRHKHFILVHQLSDNEIISTDLLANSLKMFKLGFPLNRFLNEALE